MIDAKIIIIDPQNDFTCQEGAYAQRHAIGQITGAKLNINKLIASSHQENVIIVRSDYRENQFGEGMSMCLPGTFGSQIDRDLTVNDTHTFFTKTEHSAFTSEPFNNYLMDAEVDTVVLCGFLAEYCVRQTAVDALGRGYRVYLVDDCIGTGDDVQERKQAMLRELEKIGAKIINSETDWARCCEL